MADQKEFHAKILSQKGTLFDGMCQLLFVPTAKLELAILPYHMPLISLVGRGDVRVRTQAGMRNIAMSKSGILYVGDNEAVVLVNA